MSNRHLASLRLELTECWERLEQQLNTAEVCSSLTSASEVRSNIEKLKSIWREYSSICASLRAVLKQFDDLVGSACAKSDKKLISARIVKTVAILNEMLRRAGEEVESEMQSSVSSTFSEAALCREDLRMTGNNNYNVETTLRPRLQEVTHTTFDTGYQMQQPRMDRISRSEHALLEQEATTRRSFSRWLSLASSITDPTIDAAHTSTMELRTCLARRKAILSELIDFHIYRGNRETADHWKERLTSDIASFERTMQLFNTMNSEDTSASKDISSFNFKGFEDCIDNSASSILNVPDMSNNLAIKGDVNPVLDGQAQSPPATLNPVVAVDRNLTPGPTIFEQAQITTNSSANQINSSLSNFELSAKSSTNPFHCTTFKQTVGQQPSEEQNVINTLPSITKKNTDSVITQDMLLGRDRKLNEQFYNTGGTAPCYSVSTHDRPIASRHLTITSVHPDTAIAVSQSEQRAQVSSSSSGNITPFFEEFVRRYDAGNFNTRVSSLDPPREEIHTATPIGGQSKARVHFSNDASTDAVRVSELQSAAMAKCRHTNTFTPTYQSLAEEAASRGGYPKSNLDHFYQTDCAAHNRIHDWTMSLGRSSDPFEPRSNIFSGSANATLPHRPGGFPEEVKKVTRTTPVDGGFNACKYKLGCVAGPDQGLSSARPAHPSSSNRLEGSELSHHPLVPPRFNLGSRPLLEDDKPAGQPKLTPRNLALDRDSVCNKRIEPSHMYHNELSPYQFMLESDLLRGRGEKFGGDVETYISWKDRILEYIHRAGSTPRVALEILLANTEGSAHESVKQMSRSHMSAEHQLDRVWCLFERRYGSQPILTKNLLDRLRKFTCISSCTDVDRMYELLGYCYSIFGGSESSSSVNYLSSPEGQREIWEKMPSSFVERWRKACCKLRRGGVEPTMTHLINAMSDFIEEKADPYFTDLPQGSSRTGTSLRTSVASQEEKEDRQQKNVCPLHPGTSHDLLQCNRFSKWSIDRRRNFAKKENLCFICLGQHFARDCTTGGHCSQCGAGHHDLLHPSSTPETGLFSGDTAISNCAQLCSVDGGMQCCSKTLPVTMRLQGSDLEISCFCIVDEQSNTTFCDTSLLDIFQIEGATHEYTVSTMSGLKSSISGSVVKGLQVKGWDEEEWINLPPVWTHPSIPDTSAEAATYDIVNAHSHVRKFAKHFPHKRPRLEVLLLVGTNCGEAMRTQIHGSTFPFVHHTALGWALVGPSCISPGNSKICLRTECSIEHFSLEQSSIGNNFLSSSPHKFDTFREQNDDELIGLSQEDDEFVRVIRRGTSVNSDGFLEFPLPLKADCSFPANKRAVFLRSRASLLRLEKKPHLALQCASVMGNYIEQGHVEQLPHHVDDSELVNYIPVFPTVHPKKGKVRIVFDSSATYNGVCLNDNLLRGPDSNNLLLGVLLRFRLFGVGFSGDVQCMFHCFFVAPEHRNLLRFFWWKANTPGEKAVTYRANVHVFGNRCSPAVAIHGLRHVTTLPDVDPWSPAASFIKSNFYVDDGMASVETVEEAIQILTATRELLSRFRIRFHKIISSHPLVMDSLPPTEIADDLVVKDLGASPDQTALGLRWNVQEDSLYVRYIPIQRPFTKRGVLSVIGSIFNPLGVVSPIVLGGRLLQRSFIAPANEESPFHGYGWDDPLPPSAFPQWERWLHQLPQIAKISIPRCYTHMQGTTKQSELHVFSDASVGAIGHVAYMRRTSELGEVAVGFVVASSKVSPRAASSIPRMELCAALEAAQTARRLTEELGNHVLAVHLYTDSMVVLGYIRNSSKAFSRYVSARVRTILNCFPSSTWKYVPSHENPADIASRVHTASGLLATDWLQGPSFLHESSVYAFQDPVQNKTMPLPETYEQATCLATKQEVDMPVLSHLRKFSYSWLSLVRIIGWLWIFWGKCRSAPLSEREVTELSETSLVRLTQQEVFGIEMNLLSSGKTLRNDHPMLSLAPFIDAGGILRVGGRLAAADIPYNEKHPILLPPHHFVTRAILQYYHEKGVHQGRLITTALMRQGGYHIFKQKTTVGKFLKACVICRKLRAMPLSQIMADLPKDRLEPGPPFIQSGVDVFGPYAVHDGRTTRRTVATKKVWVVLFTCLYSRAIHVDVLWSLESASFQFALRRFIAIRGECKLFKSDRGTNFVGLENQRLSDLDLHSLVDQSSHPEAKWKFLPPNASHFAGVWERKIGSIKRILDASFSLLGSVILSRDEFSTIMQEAANIVNHTPLGDISCDPNDPLPVCPATLLTLREGIAHNTQTYSEADITAYGRKRWRRVQFLADQFWSRWRRDYLRSADYRRKWKKARRSLQVGDVVLVRDTAPRNEWPMGVVTGTYPDRNGFVRRVLLRKTSRGSSVSKVTERAVSDLVLLIAVDDISA